MSNPEFSLTKIDILYKICAGSGSVHFVGVGGISMCALYCLSRRFGIHSTGSDRKKNDILSELIKNGEDIFIGERDILPAPTALLVYSHAIDENHPERILARKKSIPEISRAEYLAIIMNCYERRIGVSGSHGKSTVTAMITKIFRDAGKNPTSLCGANLFG